MKQNMKRKIRSKLRHIAETYRNINEFYIRKRANCETKHKHNKKNKIKQKIKRKLRNITETYRNICIFFIKAAAESGVGDGTPNGIHFLLEIVSQVPESRKGTSV